MNDRHASLCERIRQRCEARGWYGPDGGMEEYRLFRDAEGVLREKPVTHDARIGFESPPATQEQLDVTEARLGYPLPALLRALYADVANGGFAPGEGITGANRGYWYGQDDRYTTNDQPWPAPWPYEPIDLAVHIERHGLVNRLTLPARTWPTRFLHLCYWGCGTDSFLDASSGGVYVPEHIANFAVRLLLDAESLEAWLERWLADKRPHWWADEEVEH